VILQEEHNMLRTILLTIPLVMGGVVVTACSEKKPQEPAPATSSATVTGAPISGSVATKDSAKFFDDTFNNLQEDLETAKTDGKKGVLLMFEMDECPFCQRMKSTVLNRQDIQDYYKQNFRIISVDIEGDVELTNFKGETTTQKDFSLKDFRVRATPVFQFIGLDGEPVKNGRLTGATKDAEEFMQLGKYIAEKKNETMPFTAFKHEQN
jgi:thioredoxin-related protein